MATKDELIEECKHLRKQLEERTTAVRVTADGRIEELTPRKAAHAIAKAEAKRTGRIVTVIIKTH